MSVSKILEIIRKAEPQMNGEGYIEYVKYFMSLKDNEKEAIVKRYPNCFIKFDFSPEKVVYFPLCNRHGMFSPCTIEWSLKYANSLLNQTKSNSDAAAQLISIIGKLKKLVSIYNKNIPTPPGKSAYNKGQVTNMINHLQSDLNSIRGK